MISLLMPDLILIGALIGVLLSELAYRGETSRLTTWIVLFGFGAALIETLFFLRSGTLVSFGQAVTIDRVSIFFRLIFLLFGIVMTLVGSLFQTDAVKREPEFYVFLLGLILGAGLVSSASDLIVILAGLLLSAMCGVFLLGFGRLDKKSTQAMIHFFVLMLVSFLFFVFAAVFQLSVTQSTNLHAVRQLSLQGNIKETMVLASFALFFMATSFWIGAFPFHVWSREVIAGGSQLTSWFVGIAIRFVGLIVLIRVSAAFPQEWNVLIQISAALSMIIPAFLSIPEKNIDRLVGYWLSYQTGVILFGMIHLREDPLAAVLLEMFLSVLSLSGLFTVLLMIKGHLGSESEQWKSHTSRPGVFESVALIFFIWIWIGFPPSPTLFGRFMILGDVIRGGRLGLLIVYATSTTFIFISLARVIQSFLIRSDVAFDEKLTHRTSGRQQVVISAFAIPVVLLLIFSDRFMDWATQSVKTIFW